MPPDFHSLMQEATRLTRQGHVHAATALIQQALRTGQYSAERSMERAAEVIDVDCRVVPEGGPCPALAGSGPAAAAAAPLEESFTAGRYGGAGLAGRDYKLYVPPGASDGPRPLLVLLHGCTQDADNFAAGTRMNELAREQGFYVLYPVQSARANPQRCWNWFKRTHQQRGRGEVGLVAGMTRQVMAQHPIDPARVWVAGLSAGGALAATLLQAEPGLYAAAGIHSGLPAGAAGDLPGALEAMKHGAPRAADPVRPTIVFHGSADPTVHPRNGLLAFGTGGTVATETVHAAGHRAVTRQVRRDAAGRLLAEHWLVQGGPHAWSGGSPRGSHTDPKGPDASREMLRFFREVAPRRAGDAAG